MDKTTVSQSASSASPQSPAKVEPAGCDATVRASRDGRFAPTLRRMVRHVASGNCPEAWKRARRELSLLMQIAEDAASQAEYGWRHNVGATAGHDGACSCTLCHDLRCLKALSRKHRITPEAP